MLLLLQDGIHIQEQLDLQALPHLFRVQAPAAGFIIDDLDKAPALFFA